MDRNSKLGIRETITAIAVFFGLAWLIYSAWPLIRGALVAVGLGFLLAGCTGIRPYAEGGFGWETQVEKTYGRDPYGIASLGVEGGFTGTDRAKCSLAYMHHSSTRDFYDKSTTDSVNATCRVYLDR